MGRQVCNATKPNLCFEKKMAYTRTFNHSLKKEDFDKYAMKEDPYHQFHKDIIFCVLDCIGKYYFYKGQPYLCTERKIISEDEHKKLSKEFSDEFIKQEKDSH